MGSLSMSKPLSNDPNMQPAILQQVAQAHNLMTVKETSEYLRIPLPTVYYLVQRGQLPAIQIGGRWRVKRDMLDRDILRNAEEGQPTVLVADDDVGLQSMFRLFLKKQGYSRIVVGTGKEAIAALPYSQSRVLGSLILVDTASHKTSGALMLN